MSSSFPMSPRKWFLAWIALLCLLIAIIAPAHSPIAAAAPSPAQLLLDCPSLNALTTFKGRLFFSCDGAGTGFELWSSDGTAGGTRLFKDINPGPASSGAAYLFPIGDALFFTAQNPTKGYGLWKTDGTPDGTNLVKSFPIPSKGNLPRFTRLGDVLYFIFDDGQHGRELWRSDGTPQGTYLVKDIHPGPNDGFDYFPPHASPYFSEILATNSRLFFVANDGVHGFELWTSTGTSAGTSLVRDILPGAAEGPPYNLVAIGDKLFFALKNTSAGLWTSNGTEAGTVLVKALDVAPNQGVPYLTTLVVNKQLFFVASDGVSGIELWRSDGSPAGTQLVKDINQGADNSNPLYLTYSGGKVFFAAESAGANSGWTLWKSDGTSAGTKQVKDILPSNLVAVNQKILFAGGRNTIGSGNELWVSDGTPAGTSLLADLSPGPNSSYPQDFRIAGGHVFFTTMESGQLWALPLSEVRTRAAFAPLVWR